MLPTIGITTSFESLEDGPGEQRLRLEYVRAVESAGGLPLIVPMLEDASPMQALANRLDGLIITGGPAITAGLVGSLPGDLSDNAETRLRADQWLLEAMLEADKPVLGICYGMQLLNAHAGGTIYADVEKQTGADVHSQKRGATTHPIRIEAGTHLHRLLDQVELTVNSRHLQGLASIGNGLRASAYAPDGVIEAIENDSGSVLGVQFHPERMGALLRPLFQHLVHTAQTASSTTRAVPS